MFQHLFSPVDIGKIRLKNRLFTAPSATFSSAGNGLPTDITYEYYERRAKSGWGLVPVEACYVRNDGNPYPLFLGAATEEQCRALGRIADIMHNSGLPACIQLQHGGRGAVRKVTGEQPVAPSDTPPEGAVLEWPPTGENKPRAMTTSEVEQLSDDFAAAVVRVKKVGFDMALFHGGHGFIFNQFQARYTNHRSDKYAEPTAFTVEVIKRTREKVGPDFVLGLRMNGDDFMPGGITLDHAVRMAPAFVAAGLNYIDITAGTRERQPWSIQPLYFPRGCIVHLAEAIKKVVNVPVVTVGRINDPRLADDIIKKGKADIVAMSRGSLADPDLPLKAQEGRLEDIRRCMGCDLCMEVVGTRRGDERGEYQAATVMCAENYEVGRYGWESELKPAAVSKKIMVIGGGVAGLEFARVASLRGHQVTIYEKEQKLGGAIASAASHMPRINTHDLMNSVIYLTAQVKKQKVKTVLGKEITPELVENEKPDAIVIASGARPLLPHLHGIGNSNVMTQEDYLRDRPQVGQKIVVLGGHYGLEVAVSLARDGKDVTIIEETDRVGIGAPYLTARRRMAIWDYNFEPKPVALTNVKVKEISSQGVTIIGQNGGERVIPADTVILALGRVPHNPLELTLKGKFKEVHSIGDCVEPKNTMNAMHSAYQLARKI